MIQALVAQHFRDKEHKAGQAAQMDIVKGKGTQSPDNLHKASLLCGFPFEFDMRRLANDTRS